jgi:hypothetical protein
MFVHIFHSKRGLYAVIAQEKHEMNMEPPTVAIFPAVKGVRFLRNNPQAVDCNLWLVLGDRPF